MRVCMRILYVSLCACVLVPGLEEDTECELNRGAVKVQGEE